MSTNDAQESSGKAALNIGAGRFLPTDWLAVRNPDWSDAETSSWIGPLCQLNVLIGPNNAGKSRVLRHLFGSFPDRAFAPKGATPVAAFAQDKFAAALDRLRHSPLLDAIKSKRAPGHPLERQVRALQELASEKKNLSKFEDLLLGLLDNVNSLGTNSASIQREFEEYVLRHFGFVRTTSIPYSRVYIPILRSLQNSNLNWEPEDGFEKTIREQYKFPHIQPGKKRYEGRDKYRIITGQDFNSRIRSHLVGPLKDRKTISEFQEFLGRHFFGGASVALIPKGPEAHTDQSKHTLHIKIGQEQERPVYELGDGISSIIIMMYPLFDYRDTDLLLFIEEPENHLHPGFQRAMIDAMLRLPCDKLGSRQIFVATHSSQFLDLTLDNDNISVFHVAKELVGDGEERAARVIITPKSNASRPLLRELGMRNSAVLLTNCTIWVEGVSDRMYIRHMLRLLMDWRQDTKAQNSYPTIMEDVHFTIAEYGGANLPHWNFGDEQVDGQVWVKRMAGEGMVLVDADDTHQNPGGAKARRLAKLKRSLKNRLYVLPVREIENLIAPQVLRRVVCEREKMLEADGKLQVFQYSDYKQRYLGEFIEKRIIPAGIKPKRRYRSQQGKGTIADKAAFAKEVLDKTESWADLSQEAQALAIAIDEFVRKQQFL